MTFRCVALCLLAGVCLPGAEPDPDLTHIRSIYLLPMGGGLDQYLANRLAQTGRFHIVTDPTTADAVFTDRLGAEFEQRLDELYPPPKPPAAAEEDEDKKGAETMGDLISQASGRGGRSSTFTRGKGNVFLVDRVSRRVIWSQFLRPRSTAPEDLDRVALNVASGLSGSAKRSGKLSEKQSLPPRPKPVPATDFAPAPATPPGTSR